jgi:hypothetical protein
MSDEAMVVMTECVICRCDMALLHARECAECGLVVCPDCVDTTDHCPDCAVDIAKERQRETKT